MLCCYFTGHEKCVDVLMEVSLYMQAYRYQVLLSSHIASFDGDMNVQWRIQDGAFGANAPPPTSTE